MDFATLAVSLSQSGLRVSRTGADTLEIVGKGVLSPELKAAVHEHRAEYLRLLPDPTPPDLAEQLATGEATGWHLENGELTLGCQEWHFDPIALFCEHAPTIVWRYRDTDAWQCWHGSPPETIQQIGELRDLSSGDAVNLDGNDAPI